MHLLCLLYLSAVLVFMPLPAQAYLDPGSASLMLQAIIGTVAAGLAFASTRIAAIKAALRQFFLRK